MGMWRRQDDLERELRAQRPEPRRELLDGIANKIVGERRRSDRKLRLGVAVALSAGMLAALGSFGGLSYAANGVSHAVTSAVHAVVPTQTNAPSVSYSSAMAQYKVAMCIHGHTISVDSHAVNALKRAGATGGACGGGAFKPSTPLVAACFKGTNITIAKSAQDSRSERAKLKKFGITPGRCKA
jgi:hypothetical protein